MESATNLEVVLQLSRFWREDSYDWLLVQRGRQWRGIAFALPDLGKTVSIPKIKDIILTSADDRFSHAVIHLTEGGTKTGKIVNFTVLFINPQTDKPYDLPLSAPDDALADFGNRQMVNCAVGTITRQQ